MSLVDEIEAYLIEHPDGTADLPGAVRCQIVDTEFHDNTRWTQVFHTVFKRRTPQMVGTDLEWVKEEYALVEHHEPATEEQEDVAENYPPSVFAVEPYVVEVVRYRPC